MIGMEVSEDEEQRGWLGDGNSIWRALLIES